MLLTAEIFRAGAVVRVNNKNVTESNVGHEPENTQTQVKIGSIVGLNPDKGNGVYTFIFTLLK